jgi:integrase/recombinase XerC/integrase/recombinase XerD
MDTGEFPSVRLSFRSLQNHHQGFLRSLRHKRPETRGTYERALRSFLQWFRKDGQCRFRVKDIERYKRYLKGKRKLSEVSISTYLTAVRRLCDFLVHERVLQDNPGKLVGGSHRPLSHSRDVLTQAEVQLLLDVASTGFHEDVDERALRDLAFVKLMIVCGLSEIEIVRANVQDLQQKGESTLLWVQGKGRVRKDAAVSLPQDLVAVIDRYLVSRGELKPADPLFASAGNRTWGKRMSTRGVRERVNRSLDAAGLREGKNGNVTPGSLRHTAALLMVASGVTADQLKERMRLGSVATAMLYINQNTQLQKIE